jgi:hypothetical protein
MKNRSVKPVYHLKVLFSVNHVMCSGKVFLYGMEKQLKAMKKQIQLLLAVALTGISVQTLAQDTKSSTTVTTTTTVDNNTDNRAHDNGDYPVMYIGGRFMPTVAYFKYNQLDNSTAEATTVVSYGWGGFIGFNLSDNVALQGEVLYSPLAQKYKIAERVNTVRIDYVNIPLLLRLNTGVNRPVNLNVVFGPQFGFNVGSSIDADDNGSTTTVVSKVAVKPGDFGFAYGAGLDFLLGGYTTLGIGFRGVYGLIDISENSNSMTTDDYYVLDKTHVRSYSGYIGLSFGF